MSGLNVSVPPTGVSPPEEVRIEDGGLRWGRRRLAWPRGPKEPPAVFWAVQKG